LGGSNLAMQVETVEVLGAEHLVHGKVAGTGLIVRTGTQASPAPGAMAQFGFSAEAVHWFDPTTQLRIDS
jgi:sn-glycerol 3-phosphate transport system ATP-binding protein